MKPVIHSTKHFHQITLSTATTLATSDTTIISAVDVAAKNAANEVEEGATVKAIFFEMWTIGSVSDQFFTAVLYKLPAAAAVPTFTNMTNLTDWVNKKNILWTSQGLASNDGIGNPVAIHRNWLKIPKGKQRFGLGDKLLFTIASRGSGTITFCGFAIYKEYT